jgi:hypothetical protein
MYNAGEKVIYNKDGQSVEGTILKIHDDDDIPYYTIKLNDGTEKQTIQDNLEKTRFEILKQKRFNNTISPEERREYLQLSLDNAQNKYTKKMNKINGTSSYKGGKRKSRKNKKRKTRKGKKGRKGRKSRK